MTNPTANPLIDALNEAILAEDDAGATQAICQIDSDLTYTGTPALLTLLMKGNMPQFCAHALGDPVAGHGARIITPQQVDRVLRRITTWQFAHAPLIALGWMRGIPLWGRTVASTRTAHFPTHREDVLGMLHDLSAHDRLAFLSAVGSPYASGLTAAQWDATFGP